MSDDKPHLDPEPAREPEEEAASLKVPQAYRAAFEQALTHAERSVAGGDDDGRKKVASLRDVQATFRAHAEVLDSLLETQRRLLASIGRADRSEMMIRSTEALNETFRSLDATQRRLLERLSAGGEAPARSGPGAILVAGLLFALASAGLVFSAILLEGRGGGGDAAAEARIAALEETLASAAGARAASASAVEAAEFLRAASGDIASFLDRGDGLAARLDEEVARGEELETRASAAEREVAELRTAAVSSSLATDGFRDKYLEAEDRARRLAAEIEALRSAAPLPGPAAAAETPTIVPPAPPPGALPLEIPPETPAVTDPARLDSWRDSLNRLLASREGDDRYEMESIREVAGGTARGVKIRKISGEGTVKAYVAESFRAVLDDANRWVEFRLENGELLYAGREIPFINGRYSFMVMEVDGDAWKRAGLPFVEALPAASRGPGTPGDTAPPPVGTRRQSP